MQSMSITTNVVSSNLAQGEVYSIIVIKFVSDLQQVGGLLKVALNTINPNLTKPMILQQITHTMRNKTNNTLIIE